MSAKFNRAEFIATFKAESEEHLGKLSKGIVCLEKDPDNAELIKELFRIAHTLKGVARMMGFFEIQEIAHRIEDIFGAVSEKRIRFDSEISNRIFKALDFIKDIIGKIVKDEKIDIDVASICSELDLSKEKEAVKPVMPAAAQKRGGEKAVLNKNTQTEKESHVEPQVLTKEEPKQAAGAFFVEEYVRVSLSRVNKLLNLVGELVINKINTSQKIISLKKITKLTKESQKRLSVFFEEFKNNEDFKKNKRFKPALETLHHCNVDAEKIKEEMSGIFESISNEALHMDPIIDELQERVKGIRMLPCFTVFDDFPRLVRDIAYEQGKKINLVISGEETELDKKVLEEIKAPLVHIIRNCVDHGIELPKDRRAAGKNEEGFIKISASQEGSQVIIRIEDDGRGLDSAKIKETILKKKLCSEEELNVLSDSELAEFIFRSGFSTSPIITDISGRGVGMDVVKTQIDKLKGKVHIDSQSGKGMVVTLELPLTIAIIDVLLVKLNKQTFALPMLSIEESLEMPSNEISTVENKMAMQVRGHTVPLVRLSDVLSLSSLSETDEGSSFKKEKLSIVITASLQRRVGFIVDGILGDQEVFIKSLGQHLGKVRNVSGATVLGTGEVIIILDIADLIASSRLSRSTVGVGIGGRALGEKAKKKILVVEDSLTTRELERNILESQGYFVDTAIDGLEALDKLAQAEYDLIVCDVQMPRMNGFEFCKTFKQNEQFKNIPLVFVTSMAKEEDKRMGIEVGAQAYIIKSAFDQSNLIDTIARLIG